METSPYMPEYRKRVKSTIKGAILGQIPSLKNTN